MSDTINPQFVHWIRQASPYINQHRQKTFVIALGGSAIASEQLSGIVHDIALLKSLGIRIVIVFGIRPQLNSRLQKAGIHSTYTINNLRVSTATMMEQLWAVAGQVGTQLQAAFSSGMPDSPLHGAEINIATTNAVTARPIGVLDGIDYQHTGSIRKINTDLLNTTLDNNTIVLVPPLGYSPTGETFNLEYLDLAENIASQLRADKLIIFSKHNGIIGDKNQCIREIKCQDTGNIKGISNTQRKIIDVATKACASGVNRTHVIGYNETGSLLKELLTRDGCGSLISNDTYNQLRPATINDINGITALIKPLEEKGILVRREREVLEAEIERFMVITRDNHVIACAALYLLDNGNCAELGCIVSHSDYKGLGLGEQLLQAAEENAIALGANTLFALTTQTSHWFLQQGFVISHVDALPDDKKSLYNYQRASKVLQKTLQAK